MVCSNGSVLCNDDMLRIGKKLPNANNIWIVTYLKRKVK